MNDGAYQLLATLLLNSSKALVPAEPDVALTSLIIS